MISDASKKEATSSLSPMVVKSIFIGLICKKKYQRPRIQSDKHVCEVEIWTYSFYGQLITADDKTKFGYMKFVHLFFCLGLLFYEVTVLRKELIRPIHCEMYIHKGKGIFYMG